jgi:2',3'-cyclic-nucleotide 2'-phosphodiesterase (5'-nucleotidase family)
MRTPNDVKLAENVDEIDLILGGHDHLYEVKQVSKCQCYCGGWREWQKK